MTTKLRVFVTGATGFIGSAVVRELIDAGHSVLGLARSDESAAALKAAGADVQRGSLDDLDSLRAGASGADAVAHLAFIHDFSKFAENCEIDRRAVETLAQTLRGSNRLLFVTSGTVLLASARPVKESDAADAASPIPRVATELAVDAAGAGGAAVALVRLPPTVHGEGDHGFVPFLVDLARRTGVSAYVGDGSNRWPAVHRLDAAHLYRLALEKGEGGGVRYHAVAEEGIRFRDIAEEIAKGLGVPAVSKSPEEAAEHFAWFAHFAGVDAPASSSQTRSALAWSPSHPTLSEDLGSGVYFKETAKTSMLG
ncbi:MAG TPA: SDR family oxidoreductase [Candidatus Tumulicola sp.]|jgi:nucleoside-diphosphate-sugar epimerase